MDDIIEIITNSAPEGANIEVSDTNEPRVRASWLLNSDPSRPSKRAIAVFVISREFLEDFPAEPQRDSAIEQVRSFVMQCFTETNFDHDEDPSPVHRFTIGSNVLA